MGCYHADLNETWTAVVVVGRVGRTGYAKVKKIGNGYSKMTVSLVITTYNWKEALSLCLSSVCGQTRMPDQVIIADDGSADDTRRLIDERRKGFGCPLIHVWQEDKGFRRARIINKALRECTSDYVVFIDGDIICDRHFIEDHCRIARRGYFVTGSRANIRTEDAYRLEGKKPLRVSFFTKGVERWENAVRLPFLFPLSRFCYHGKPLHGRGANMAVFMDDLKAVNGYNEDIEGYGYEDVELFNRLYNLGVKRNWAKWICVEYHIMHNRSTVTEGNRKFFDETLNSVTSENGLVHEHTREPDGKAET